MHYQSTQDFNIDADGLLSSMQADFAGPIRRCIGVTNVSTCPDPVGPPEEHAQQAEPVQLWAKKVRADGTTAILLLNMHTSAFTAEVDFAKDLGLHQSMRQHDIWTGKDGATGTSARLEVPSYDSAFWLLTPA